MVSTVLVSLLAVTAVMAAPGKRLSAREIAGIPLAGVVAPIRKASVNPNVKNTPVGAAYRQFPQLASASPDAADANQPVGIARAADRQIEYITDVTLGTKNVSLIVDTGSSDTWAVQAQFRCVDPQTQRVVATTMCNFGPTYPGGFTEGEISNQIFAVQYGSADGPFVQGRFGYADVTVAGVTVKKQQIALALEGAWRGDQISSGILGLGLAPLTGAYNSQTGRAETYDPLVVTMSKSGGIAPIFALALDRDSSKSFLSLGGLPDIETGTFATTPIVKASTGVYARYTIQPDKFVVNASTGQSYTLQNPQVIIDSGTTLNMLPTQMAATINKMYDPPAQYDQYQGQYFVSCNAKPPAFGVQIGGQMFWTDPKNMILPEVVDPDTGMCSTGIAGTDGAPYILGDAFMQGVVSVFDISSKMEIRFAKRS